MLTPCIAAAGVARIAPASPRKSPSRTVIGVGPNASRAVRSGADDDVAAAQRGEERVQPILIHAQQVDRIGTVGGGRRRHAEVGHPHRRECRMERAGGRIDRQIAFLLPKQDTIQPVRIAGGHGVEVHLVGAAEVHVERIDGRRRRVVVDASVPDLGRRIRRDAQRHERSRTGAQPINSGA